jgi:hypothetical protein
MTTPSSTARSPARWVVTDAPLIRPLAADATVSVDAAKRELIVKPHPDARPLARVLWAEGIRAQVEAGYGRAPTVWAAGAGQDRVSFGLPDGNALRFRFHRGHPVYKALVSTPGLSARFVVDRGTAQILSVRFTGRRAP